ncbi:hypothetical protein CR105_21430 [Massilia eurypsychrophila]|jgi:uncharacterized tellurite resistance protein B-like protein|uniref:Co-chaperone DjlA N-terminal domain-containing protein n=1 Tax=Massilia eurypsychrophila TaxID=1485217 RepID=A0A2G8TAC6_9BURK|nr:TerB family tellurite resistance protein [Massilia eurypsychrophila]PIL42929.1 hypothetical protein CR105_21430 [Massilia eurypsychrophila]
MRSYELNSGQAAARVLALTMVVDGNLAQSELIAMDRTRILRYVDLERDDFHQLLQELCEDLLTTAEHGDVRIDARLIDGVLGEIADPQLRRHLLKAMWSIADADDWLADAEAVLLARATVLWAAQTGFAAAS